MESLPLVLASALPIVGACFLLFFSRRWIGLALFRYVQSLKRDKPGTNPFLSGVYEPVDKEVHSLKLPTDGAVPKELEGWYARTGPNPQFHPNGGYHLFDGEAMIHSIVFRGGEAKAYSNHWVQCPMLQEEKKAGKNLYLRMGDLKGVRGLILLMMRSAFGLHPNAPLREQAAMGNTALTYFRQKMLALHEASVPFELRMLCSGLVESMGALNFGGKLTAPFSAHPKEDPTTGILHTFGYEVGKAPHLVYYTISAEGELSEQVPINIRGPAMLHDFAISRKFAIFLEHSLVFKPEVMVKKGMLPFVSDLDKPGRIGLLPLLSPNEPVQWFDVDPYVFFHAANAWDEGDLVHVVLCIFDNIEQMDLGNMTPDKPGGFSKQMLVRYTIDTKAGTVTRTFLCHGLVLDFPVVAPQMVGSANSRFCWCCEFKDMLGVAIVKADMKAADGAGFAGRIDFGPTMKGGEFSFVPRDGAALACQAAADDDGFLVGYVTDESTWTSYCMVYDAKTMSSTPLAKITVPQRVPFGFHGTFAASTRANGIILA